MEIRIIPVVSVVVAVGAVALAVTAGNSKKASIYLDAPNTPTTNNFDAKQVAETLYIAMNRYGTDKDTIMQVLNDVSESQFASVVLAFGSRRYNTWTGDEYGLYKYPLKDWLKSELLGWFEDSYLTLKSKFKKYL
jgi:hypothetical protein